MPVCRHACICICCILMGFIAFWNFEIKLTYLLTYVVEEHGLTFIVLEVRFLCIKVAGQLL